MPSNCNTKLTHRGRLKGQNTTKNIYTHTGIPPKRKTQPIRTDERHTTSIQIHKRANGVPWNVNYHTVSENVPILRVARRRRQGAMNPLHTGWTPQSHGRHVVRCPSNAMSRRHSLHHFRRKLLPVERHPHDLRGHPVERGHKLLQHLKIRQYQARIMLEMQRSRQNLLTPHVVEPVFWTMAEQSSRFRRTHIPQQPRVELRTSIILIIRSHAVLIAPQTVQYPWRGPDLDES